MFQLLIFSAINGLSLALGSATGIFFKLKQKTIAAFMAFGAGVLICAITFGLMEEAFKHGGFDAVITGFILGGAVFIGGDYLIHKMGGRKHKRKPLMKQTGDTNGAVIVLGSVLDGIPESVALGIAIFSNQGTGMLMLAAIFLSNFPESISSVGGLKREGFSKRKIFLMWLAVGIVMALMTFFSFIFLHGINPNTIGIFEAFAAGAILAMLADGMMPEAYEEGGFSIAALTILGFITAFVISRL
jgi:zinc transporter, ZIP family